MNGHNDSVKKAGAPSRRRRSFLAVQGSSTAPPHPTPHPHHAIDEDEDIPILTEIVPAEAAPPPPLLSRAFPESAIPENFTSPESWDTFEAQGEDFAAQADVPVLPPSTTVENSAARELLPPESLDAIKGQLEGLAAQMSQAIGKQMAYELPSLIEATLLNVSDELRTGIMATMDAALRDFIASRGQSR